MDKRLEEMVRLYIELGKTEGVSSHDRVLNSKKRRDLWGAILQEIKDSPKAMKMKIFRVAHPEKAMEQYIYQRDKHRQLKVDVMTHYGKGECACVICSENRLDCLSIDHIEGGGNKHRKTTLRSTGSFYKWLKTNDYPEGYQTLCMNCQFAKRFERGEHR